MHLRSYGQTQQFIETAFWGKKAGLEACRPATPLKSVDFPAIKINQPMKGRIHGCHGTYIRW